MQVNSGTKTLGVMYPVFPGCQVQTRLDLSIRPHDLDVLPTAVLLTAAYEPIPFLLELLLQELLDNVMALRGCSSFHALW